MILVRHGESHFNRHFGVTRVDPRIVDPSLTQAGIHQTEDAAKALVSADIDRIVASPYTRTLQTAEILAEKLELSVTVEPLVRERAYFTCDIGTPRSELEQHWPHFNFADLTERWWPDLDETEHQLHHRCHSFREVMVQVEDWHRVLVVTHWGFIRGLTGQEVTNAEIVRYDPTTVAA